MTDGAAIASGAQPGSRSAALEEWRRGWPVVLAGLFGCMLISLGQMSIGAFMAPMRSAFGWSASEFSLGFSAHAIGPGLLLPPLVGILIDRFGPRAIAVIGSLVAGVTFSLFATVTGSIGNWILHWLLYGSAGQLIVSTLWYAAVASVFNVSRGFAISVVMCGAAVAGVVGPVMANILIEEYGFRAAFVGMGMSWGLTVALMAWFGMPGRGGTIRRAPAPTEDERQHGRAEPLTGLTVREGLRSATFLKLVVLIFITYAALLALTLHLIPLLSASGLARQNAVIIASFFGLAIIVGKIAAGIANDRLPGKLIAAFCNFTLAVSLAMLALPKPSIGWAAAAVILGGLSYGGIAPTYPYLASRHFGMRSFGRLFGVLACFYSLGTAVGPWVAGRVFDVTGSYVMYLLGTIPTLLVAIVLCFTLGRYPEFDNAV